MFVWSIDIENRVIDLFLEGKTPQFIRTELCIPQRDWYDRLDSDSLFCNKCARARSEGLEELADELLTIADTEHNVLKARLKSENYKWILSKRKPKTYGDRLDLNVEGTISIVNALDEATARVRTVNVVNMQIEDIAKNAKSLNSSGNTEKETDIESVDVDTSIFD